MADPNHIVLTHHKLVLMLPCKVGNSSVKAAVASTLGMRIEKRQLHHSPDWRYEGKEWIASRDKGWLTIGFVRHPYARFMSAWRNKVRDQNRMHFTGGAKTIDEVAVALPKIRNQHWRSLVDELCLGGRPLCNLVVKTDDMPAAWKTVQGAVHGHCGLLLHRIPHLNQTVGDETLSPRAKELIAAHYADDFRMFGYQP